MERRSLNTLIIMIMIIIIIKIPGSLPAISSRVIPVT